MSRASKNHANALPEAAIDRAETSIENYEDKLLEFLMYVTENVWAAPTEKSTYQNLSSSHTRHQADRSAPKFQSGQARHPLANRFTTKQH